MNQQATVHHLQWMHVQDKPFDLLSLPKMPSETQVQWLPVERVTLSDVRKVYLNSEKFDEFAQYLWGIGIPNDEALEYWNELNDPNQ